MKFSDVVAVSSADRSLRFYDAGRGGSFALVGCISPMPNMPTRLVYYRGPHSQMREVLACADDRGWVHVWHLNSDWWFGEVSRFYSKATPSKLSHGVWRHFTVQAHDDLITDMQYIVDLDSIVTASLDGKVHFLALDRPLVRRTFDGHAGKPVNCFAYFSRYKRMASAGTDRIIRMWDPYTCKVAASMDKHSTSVMKMCALESENQLVTVSADKHIICWDMASNDYECIQLFIDTESHRPTNAISDIYYDDASRRLLTASNYIKSWHLTCGKDKRHKNTHIKTHEVAPADALYNREFHQVVSAAGNEIFVWDMENGSLSFRFADANNESPITAICFDDSNRRLITGTHNGVVKMWNFSNGACLRLFERPETLDASDKKREITSIKYVNLGAGQKFVVCTGWMRQIHVYHDLPQEGVRYSLKAVPSQGVSHIMPLEKKAETTATTTMWPAYALRHPIRYALEGTAVSYFRGV